MLKPEDKIAIWMEASIDDDFGKRLFNEIKNKRHIIVTFGKSLDADVKINSIKQNNQNIDLNDINKNNI
mgnify:CR=1 FL=1